MRASNTVSACRVTMRFPSVTRSIAIQTSSGSAVRTSSMRLTRPMVTRALGARQCCRRLMQWESYLQSTESWARRPSARSSSMLSACRPIRTSACEKRCITLSATEFLTSLSTSLLNQPAYIVVPSDYALAPITPADVRPMTIKSNETSLQKTVAVITERLKSAKSVVALPAFTISRLGLQKEARAAIEAIGCPFATTSMEKCIIDESHPQFAGMYSGALSTQETRQIVEGAELVLDIGGVSLNDETTAGFSGRLDFGRFVSIGLNDVRIGEQVFGNVRLADMLAALAKFESGAPRYKRTTPEGNPSINGKPSDKITMDALYPRYAKFIRSGDNVVLESGSSSFGVPPMTLS